MGFFSFVSFSFSFFSSPRGGTGRPGRSSGYPARFAKHRSVQLADGGIREAGALVQPVDVLGDDPGDEPRGVKRGDGAVREGGFAGFEARDANLDSLGAHRPDALGSAEIGDAGGGADAGARVHDEGGSVQGSDQARDVRDALGDDLRGIRAGFRARRGLRPAASVAGVAGDARGVLREEGEIGGRAGLGGARQDRAEASFKRLRLDAALVCLARLAFHPRSGAVGGGGGGECPRGGVGRDEREEC